MNDSIIALNNGFSGGLLCGIGISIYVIIFLAENPLFTQDLLIKLVN